MKSFGDKAVLCSHIGTNIKDIYMPEVTPSLAHFLVDALRSTGLDVDRLCQAVGLNIHDLSFDEVGTPRVKLYRLYTLAAEVSHDPNIGLRAASQVSLGIFDVVGYVMMSSATLAAALERLVHLVTLLDTSISVSLQSLGEQYRLSCHFLDSHEVPRPYGDAAIAIMFGLCRALAGPTLKLCGVGVMHLPPADTSAYEQTFHCPVAFADPCYWIMLSGSDLKKTLVSANKQLAPLHELVAEMHLSTRGLSSISGEVRKIILESLSEGVPNIEDLAKKLCISKRTLQRLLQRAGQSYKEIINETRRSQTEFHLANPKVTLQEVAYRVGFREMSSFYRACHQWYGMTPGKYRILLNTAIRWREDIPDTPAREMPS
ncbi:MULTISPECIES: AraC family transcriptional regulator [Pseudomonas]|uniref:AraC family transcriptional regulator n=1 Tax=Pseudomonas TaxID=286 RepID=UPI001C115760|nr:MULTISPECIES: AraC family transcriptional regulator [Pseudomonas]ELQ8318165.1 AraC family transcriptional regulator [Pseudomonas aeruginosa]MBU5733068.1 AraC family transcriptional regulator [Pseudomonas aeruginosa]UUJ38945.1 AraC family transcriptional regulator [Pseudomonas extremaustralis]HDQ4470833.1 AraC family transcriptional regulator [Pseudomonas aeruginosa]